MTMLGHALQQVI